MQLDVFVCPDCGNDEFSRTESAVVKITGRYYVGGQHEGVETVEDLEHDYESFTCTDCGSTHDPDDLMTEDAYNAENGRECESCGAHAVDEAGRCDDCGEFNPDESEAV